jgi:hypothetical protein
MKRTVLWTVLRFGLCSGFVAGAAACARVPNETVELSTALGSDLADTRQAHRTLVSNYFGLIRREINAFVDTKYRPFVIRFLLTHEGFDKEFASATAKSTSGSSDLIDLAEVFTEEISSHVAEYRAGLMAPVDSLEHDLLTRLDARYSLMSSASAELTGYLASLRKLQTTREATWQRLGLGGIENQVGTSLANFSDKIQRLNDKASQIEDAVRDGKEQVEDAMKALRALRDSLATSDSSPTRSPR